MKIYAQILCVVMLALVYSCDAFFLRGQGGSISASASISPGASRKPRIDPRAILGYAKTQILVHFCQKNISYVLANWLE